MKNIEEYFGYLISSRNFILAALVVGAVTVLSVPAAQAYTWTFSGTSGDPDLLDPGDVVAGEQLEAIGDTDAAGGDAYGELTGDATAESVAVGQTGSLGGGPAHAMFSLGGYTLTLNSGEFDNLSRGQINDGTLQAASGQTLTYMGGSGVDSRWTPDFVGDSGMLVQGDRMSVDGGNAHGVDGDFTIESQITIRTGGWFNPDSAVNINGSLQSQGNETIAGLNGSGGLYQSLGGARTLTINVADGETYNYEGTLEAGLKPEEWGVHVVKQGLGTQILNGDINGANSEVTVEQGKLGISQDSYDTLSLDTNGVTVGNDGTLIINLDGEYSDYLDIAGDLSISGGVEVAYVGTPTTSEYLIADASLIDITDATISGDGVWDFELRNSDTQLYLIPEPSALILLALGGLLMLSRRKV